jgi:hypothetical protein
MLSIKSSSMLMISASENFLVESDCFLHNTICPLFDGRVFQQTRHTYGYKLSSSSCRLVPLFIWDRLHTGASHEKRKEANPILTSHLYLRWPFFLKTHSWKNSLYISFSLEWEIVV